MLSVFGVDQKVMRVENGDGIGSLSSAITSVGCEPATTRCDVMRCDAQGGRADVASS